MVRGPCRAWTPRFVSRRGSGGFTDVRAKGFPLPRFVVKPILWLCIFADLRKCVKPDVRVNVFQQMRFYASKVLCVSGDAGPRSRAAHRVANGVSPPSGFHR